MRSRGHASASPARKNRRLSAGQATDVRTAAAPDRVRRRPLALLERHEASARIVSHYDFNNTYQYVINREETQLSWVQNALAEYGAVLPPATSAALPAPEAPPTKKRVEASAYREHPRRRRAVPRRVRGEVASARRRNVARAAPHDAERRPRRVDGAQTPLRAGGRSASRICSAAGPPGPSVWAQSCRRAGWSRRRESPSPSAAISATGNASFAARSPRSRRSFHTCASRRSTKPSLLASRRRSRSS